MFVHNKTKISTYLTKYLEYILVNLPTEEQDALKGISPNLLEVKNILQELYDESHTQIASNALDEILLDNINETAIKFEDLNTQINNTNSFSTIELINYGSDEVEHQIGLVDKDYFGKIRNKLSFVNEMVEKTILEDKTPQKYRILIYSLSTDTGNGKAKLFHGMTEEFDRVFIHIISNEKEIKGSIYTNGLHEGKVIDVLGIATKIDSNYKSLKIEL